MSKTPLELWCVAALVSLLLGTAVRAQAFIDVPAVRRTTPKDLSLTVERFVLANGLTVLLSPDPTLSDVVVKLTFRAGTLYEPPGRSGIAHLAEHIMVGNREPGTNYVAMLEQRGARGVNAFTTFDLMSFQQTVPAEELPFALWVSADRLGTLPGLLNAEELERNRRIVVEERALRVGDVPYGGIEVAMFQHLYPNPHPLHGMVLGDPKELAAISAEDVRAFVSRCLGPANGILTLVGNFDPAVAKEWIAQTMARLPPGTRLNPPKTAGRILGEEVLTLAEPRSRRPRVTMAWRFGEHHDDVADALHFGALMLAIYTDGTFGVEIDSAFAPYAGGGLFVINATFPDVRTARDAQDEAEAFVRYITRVRMPVDLMTATLLAWDLRTLKALESPQLRADLLTRMEYLGKDPTRAEKFNERHWALDPETVQNIARGALGKSRVVLRALPTRPRMPRAARE